MSRKTTAAAAITEPAQADLLPVNIPPAARHPKVRMITRSQIHPDPEQPRQQADAGIRDSIARNGLLQPITVRPHPTIMTEFMIVDGERRWLSSAGVIEDLPCIVRQDMDELSRRLATQLEANTGKPLTPLEEAKAFARLIEDSGLSVADLADHLGRAKSTVAERLALLELGPWLELLESGDVVLSHAIKVLLPLRTVPDSYHEKAIALLRNDYRWKNQGKGEGISLRDFERLVEQIYRAAMYPLTKTKDYGKQPEFTTSKHDAECGCGGIKFDLGGGTPRLCCGNPGWWRPLHRAALKAKKPAGGKSAAPKGKTLYLPADAKTVKSNYGQTPNGVVQLTDANGDWNTRELGCDPTDLVIDAAKLVTWKPDYGSGYPYVGTTDLGAVAFARAKWNARWAEEEKTQRAALVAAIGKSKGTYAIDGPGAPVLAGQLSGDLAARAILDIAEANAIPVPASVTKGSTWELGSRVQKWVRALSQANAAEILTAVATIAGEDLLLPSQRVEQLQRRALEAIRKRTIPWKTKPKAEPAAKKSPAKASLRSPNADFMKARYPSPALAAVIGNNPMPRTDVTVKLWKYIKKHGLQDAKNRRMINADDLLQPVFGGKAQASMFEITKMVDKHLAGTAEAAAPIGTSKKAKGKTKPAGVPFSKLSDETAELPLVDERRLNDHVASSQGDVDDEQEGAWYSGPDVGDEDDDLWDSTDDADDLEEATS